jgi:signal transduction histidine kinase
MSSSSPRSFRRLLIVRLLLLGIPILLIGQYVTLRQGRTNLLETARQNLSSSALRKGDLLGKSLQLLQSNLQTLSQSTALQRGDLAAVEVQVRQFLNQLPWETVCLEVVQGRSPDLVLTTCGAPLAVPVDDLPWAIANGNGQDTPTSFYLSRLRAAATQTTAARAQIQVVLSAPVYDEADQLRYTLNLQVELEQLQNTGARSLVGHTVLIDPQGIVQVHPDPNVVGQPLTDLPAGERLAIIQRRSQAQETATLHLFSFWNGTGYDEWLAGFAPLELAISPTRSETWTVLAVTPIDHALEGLQDIRDVLVMFTLGLLAAQMILVLYLARRLSSPMERLCNYAQQLQDLSEFREVPQNFRVWELNHLAKVLNRMLHRLEQRASDLQHAWQEAQMANQLKSEFLANTSHELRTPLNAIIGCIRLVRDNCCDSPEEEQEFLERADQAAIHLLEVINDILDIAKIESGTLDLYIEPLDVRSILTEVVELQTIQAQQKGIDLFGPDLSEPVWVRADRSKLKQVLLNVVYNAIKFTDEGQVTLTATVEAAATDPNEQSATPSLPPSVAALPTPSPRLIISVQDTGIGIDPQQQSKLFQPFVMADGSTTRRFEGTGLGLAISRNLMTLMEGSITLHSEGIGQGTLVAIALPLLAPTAIPTSARDGDEDATQPMAIAPSSSAPST